MKICMCFFILLIFSQCGFKEKKDENVIITKLKRGQSLNRKEWKCYKVENNDVCIPSKWKPAEQDKVFYFAGLNNGDWRTFFTVIKFDVKSNKLDSEHYLKEGYHQMLRDTVEIFKGYTLKKITFDNKKSYYAEYFANVNKTEYFAYSMVFEIDGFLYDIALKLHKNVSHEYKDTFQNILFNFKVNGKNVFDEYDKIEGIDTIDLSK